MTTIEQLVLEHALLAACERAGVAPRFGPAVRALFLDAHLDRIEVVQEGAAHRAVVHTDVGPVEVGAMVAAWALTPAVEQYLLLPETKGERTWT